MPTCRQFDLHNLAQSRLRSSRLGFRARNPNAARNSVNATGPPINFRSVFEQSPGGLTQLEPIRREPHAVGYNTVGCEANERIRSLCRYNFQNSLRKTTAEYRMARLFPSANPPSPTRPLHERKNEWKKP